MTLQRMTMSASQLWDLNKCPLRFYRQHQKIYDDTVTYAWSVYGRAVHRCVEIFHKNLNPKLGGYKYKTLGEPMPDFEFILEEVIREEVDAGKEVLLINKGKEINKELWNKKRVVALENYAKLHEKIPGKVIAVEKHLSEGYVFKNLGVYLILHGTLDQLRVLEDGSLYVADIKSGSEATDRSEHQVLRMMQLLIYSHFVRYHLMTSGRSEERTMAPPAVIQMLRYWPYTRGSKDGLFKKGDLRGHEFVQPDIAPAQYTQALDSMFESYLLPQLEYAVRAVKGGIILPTCSDDWVCKQCDKSWCAEQLIGAKEVSLTPPKEEVPVVEGLSQS